MKEFFFQKILKQDILLTVKLQTRQPALSCQLVVFHPGFFRLSRPEVPAGGSTANSPP